MLKTQQGSKSEKINVFTEELNKTALVLNNNKIIQSIDLIKNIFICS